MRYRLRTGSFAWLIHRITGISLTLYIFLHLYVLSHLKDPARYESIMKQMENPIMRLGELALLILVFTHALNGFRLVLIDTGVPTRFQKTLFGIAATTGILIFVFGAIHFLRGGH